MKIKTMLAIGTLVTLPLQAQSLAVSSPNGGENWTLGSVRPITWTATAYTGLVRLVLFDGGTKVGPIKSGLNAGPGSFDWTVGQYEGGTAPAGTNYRIRIVSADGTLGDYSDAAFTIGEAKPIVIQKPPERLPPALRFPRLEVSRIWLAPNVDGYAVVFNYKNAGNGPLPKAADLPFKPSFRVLLNGEEAVKGVLFIPAFPAEPGWEQVGFAGPQVDFPRWSQIPEGGLTYYNWRVPNFANVIINENRSAGMPYHSAAVNIHDLALESKYDLRGHELIYDWKNHVLTISAEMAGLIPKGRELQMVCKHSRGRFEETRPVSGTSYVFTRKVDPGDLERIDFDVFLFVKPLNPQERIGDIDWSNNFLGKSLARPK